MILPSETTKKNTPRLKRNPDASPFQMQDRDIKVLKAVNILRYLKTDQIKRLLFQFCGMQSVKRRLRKLFDHGFLGRIEAYARHGQGSFEMAYYLDTEGIKFLKEYQEETGEIFDITPYSKPPRIKNTFLYHSLMVSEFCINLMLSLEKNPNLELVKLSIDCEIKEHAKKQRIKTIDRYRLFDKVIINGEDYQIYPDVMAVLRVRGTSDKALYFIEIDRSTENLEVIRNKVIGYSAYKNEPNLFTRKYGKYGVKTFNRLLFVTLSENRSQSIKKALKNLEGRDFTWITDISKLNPETLLNGSIWLDHEGMERVIFGR